MRYSIPLLANQPTRQPLRGKCVLIKGTGAAPVVTLELVKGSEQDVENFGEVGRNFSLYDADGGGFSGLILTATVNATIDVIVTNYDARARDGDSVAAAITAPLTDGRVSTDARAPGYNITQTKVAITAANQQVLAANASRRYLAFMVVGTEDVTIKPDAGAVVGDGMILQGMGVSKQGGTFTFDGAAPTDAFHAIAAGVGSNLIVWEGV